MHFRAFLCVLVLLLGVNSKPHPRNNLLEAYFKHREAHNSLHSNRHVLRTNGRNYLDYSAEEAAREPGSFVKLHENKLKGWQGLSQPVSPHRDELRAATMIQKLHSYSKRLAGHIAAAAAA
ncbi:unnamed protein product [Caenorhabditis sp. 36 PRJEB53466]|nr:unnamed protein product [Caenorhabditis sp. 36 PRJEB53466]